VARLVARRLLRLLEPGNGLVDPVQVDQVGADVVVRVPEGRIDPDGDLALVDRLFVPPLERIGPAEERVGLGGRVKLDGRAVEPDGVLERAGRLPLVGTLQQPDGPLDPIVLSHDPQASAGTPAGSPGHRS